MVAFLVSRGADLSHPRDGHRLGVADQQRAARAVPDPSAVSRRCSTRRVRDASPASRTMVEAGADADRPNPDGMTPMMMALEKRDAGGRRIRDAWSGLLWSRGVHTRDVARQAVDAGADAVIVAITAGVSSMAWRPAFASFPVVAAVLGDREMSLWTCIPPRRRYRQGALSRRASCVDPWRRATAGHRARRADQALPCYRAS